MDDVKLTKEADALLCVLYKEYLQRREDGASKGDAKLFGGSSRIQADFLPKWITADVDDACWELARAGLLVCQNADNTVWNTFLDNAGIIYMEARFPRGLSQLIERLAKIKSAIPLW